MVRSEMRMSCWLLHWMSSPTRTGAALSDRAAKAQLTCSPADLRIPIRPPPPAAADFASDVGWEKRSLTNQDTFDHDKGQKSAISGLRLHWIFFNFLQCIFCPLLQVYCVI